MNAIPDEVMAVLDIAMNRWLRSARDDPYDYERDLVDAVAALPEITNQPIPYKLKAREVDPDKHLVWSQVNEGWTAVRADKNYGFWMEGRCWRSQDVIVIDKPQPERLTDERLRELSVATQRSLEHVRSDYDADVLAALEELKERRTAEAQQ